MLIMLYIAYDISQRTIAPWHKKEQVKQEKVN